MTTLTLPTQPEASLPSMGDQEYVVLGHPMNAIVCRVIEARCAFVDATRFTFWRNAFAAEFPELDSDSEPWRTAPLTEVDVQLSAEFGAASMVLVETKLPPCED